MKSKRNEYGELSHTIDDLEGLDNSTYKNVLSHIDRRNSCY